MIKPDKYQVWASGPLETQPTIEGTEYLGWEMILTSDDINDIFTAALRARTRYKDVITTNRMELEAKIVGDVYVS